MNSGFSFFYGGGCWTSPFYFRLIDLLCCFSWTTNGCTACPGWPCWIAACGFWRPGAAPGRFSCRRTRFFLIRTVGVYFAWSAAISARGASLGSWTWRPRVGGFCSCGSFTCPINLSRDSAAWSWFWKIGSFSWIFNFFFIGCSYRTTKSAGCFYKPGRSGSILQCRYFFTCQRTIISTFKIA